jgi:two-component system phosphate regulon response regulator PhoB
MDETRYESAGVEHRAGDGATVLVADDNTDIRQLLATRLTSRGYRVIEAADGGEALEKIREHQPDAVILDWVMPILQGHELCVQLKSEPATAGIPVMMLTARGSSQDRLLGLDLGADAYVVKPFDFEEVVSQLAGLIAGHRG